MQYFKIFITHLTLSSENPNNVLRKEMASVGWLVNDEFRRIQGVSLRFPGMKIQKHKYPVGRAEPLPRLEPNPQSSSLRTVRLHQTLRSQIHTTNECRCVAWPPRYSSILRNESNYLRNYMTIGIWWTVRVSNPEGATFFSSPKPPRRSLWHTQPLIQRAPAFFLFGKEARAWSWPLTSK